MINQFRINYCAHSRLVFSVTDNHIPNFCPLGSHASTVTRSFANYLTVECYNNIKAYVFQAAYEMPYVVRLNNVVLLDTPQPLFFFKHPNKGQQDLFTTFI